jgi:hypothetical protein
VISRNAVRGAAAGSIVGARLCRAIAPQKRIIAQRSTAPTDGHRSDAKWRARLAGCSGIGYAKAGQVVPIMDVSVAGGNLVIGGGVFDVVTLRFAHPARVPAFV